MKVFIDRASNRTWTFSPDDKELIKLQTKATLSILDKLSVRYYLEVWNNELDIRIPEQKITLKEEDMTKVMSVFEELVNYFKLEYLGNECGDLRFELTWEE